jgi:hypothetical protein
MDGTRWQTVVSLTERLQCHMEFPGDEWAAALSGLSDAECLEVYDRCIRPWRERMIVELRAIYPTLSAADQASLRARMPSWMEALVSGGPRGLEQPLDEPPDTPYEQCLAGVDALLVDVEARLALDGSPVEAGSTILFEAAQRYLHSLLGDQLQDVPMYRLPDGMWGMRYDELWSVLGTRADGEAIDARLWDEYGAAEWLLFPEAVLEATRSEVEAETRQAHQMGICTPETCRWCRRGE